MLQVTRIVVVLGMMLGVAYGTHAIAGKQVVADKNQSTIAALTKHMNAISTELSQTVNTEHKNTQAAISDLHKQTETQILHLQKEIQELQGNLSKEMKMMQVEIKRLSDHVAGSKKEASVDKK